MGALHQSDSSNRTPEAATGSAGHGLSTVEGKGRERRRVVVTGLWDRPACHAHLQQPDWHVVLGHSLEEFPGEAYTEAELVELVRDADAVLVSPRERLTRRVLEAATSLRIVAKATIGVEKIDGDAATDLGILVVNSPAPENFLGLAEATVGLILALNKRMVASQRLLLEGRWKDTSSFGTLLAGQTVGIVGFGRTGANVARRLAGWDVRLLATDKYVDAARARAVGVELVPLETLLAASDVVTLHVVLTPETRHLIDETRLRAMRPTSYLVNTSRGQVIDEAALVRAIEGGWIAGAALDVFEEEPLPLDSPLRRLDPECVILTPHCIGNNVASLDTGVQMATDNILRALRGELPDNITNPAAIDLWRRRFGKR